MNTISLNARSLRISLAYPILVATLLLSGCGIKTLNVPQPSITPSEKNLKSCLSIDGTYEDASGDIPSLYLERGLLTIEAEARLQSNRIHTSSPKAKDDKKDAPHYWITLNTNDDGQSIQMTVFSDNGMEAPVLIESSQMRNELSCTPVYWESARSYNENMGGKIPHKIQEHTRLSKLPNGDLLMDYKMDDWIESSWDLKKREARKEQAVFKKTDVSLKDIQEGNEKMKKAQTSYTPQNKDYLPKCTVTYQFSVLGGARWDYNRKVSIDGKELPPLRSYMDGINNATYCRP